MWISTDLSYFVSVYMHFESAYMVDMTDFVDNVDKIKKLFLKALTNTVLTSTVFL